MKIEVVTLFPRMIAGTLEFGIVGRAIARGLLSVGTEDPRAHTDDVHRTQHRSHTRPCRNTSQSLSGFDTFTRVAGSRHPERNRAESVAW